jgi:pimeloyl-ACP methyl ester carboxylesterase
MMLGMIRFRLRRWLGGGAAAATAARARRLTVSDDPADKPWKALMALTMALRPKLATINADVLPLADVRAIVAPTLLLIGERETLYDPARTLAVAKARMPKITAELVPAADHIAALAQPDAVNARILAFLDAAKPGASTGAPSS